MNTDARLWLFLRVGRAFSFRAAAGHPLPPPQDCRGRYGGKFMRLPSR